MSNLSIVDPAFRRGCEHLAVLGPRAVAELLIEIGAAHGCSHDIARRLESYRHISPAVLAAVGGCEFPRLIWRAA